MSEHQEIYKALKSLADPTRRMVFEVVAKAGEISVSALTRAFDVSQPAISQHLKHLRDAGLVIERRAGREAFYRPVPGSLTPLRGWMDKFDAPNSAGAEPVKRKNARLK